MAAGDGAGIFRGVEFDSVVFPADDDDVFFIVAYVVDDVIGVWVFVVFCIRAFAPVYFLLACVVVFLGAGFAGSVVDLGGLDGVFGFVEGRVVGDDGLVSGLEDVFEGFVLGLGGVVALDVRGLFAGFDGFFFYDFCFSDFGGVFYCDSRRAVCGSVYRVVFSVFDVFFGAAFGWVIVVRYWRRVADNSGAADFDDDADVAFELGVEGRDEVDYVLVCVGVSVLVGVLGDDDGFFAFVVYIEGEAVVVDVVNFGFLIGAE